MSDSGKIYLSSLSSKHLELAKSVNKDGNEYLSGDEVSIFLAECELNGMDFKPSISSRILNTIFTVWDDCAESVSKLFSYLLLIYVNISKVFLKNAVNKSVG